MTQPNLFAQHETTYTLQELNYRIGSAILAARDTQQVWVAAELMDVSCKGGHFYMELVQKDSQGVPLAKSRAMIWRSQTRQVTEFERITGQRFTSGIKVRLRVSATMHSVFGLSLNITEIDPTFTMGDLELRRREILQRLTNDGILNDNRNLQWPTLPFNIAIISSPEAAGYGDFMKHLHTNGLKFRFNTQLFPAIMQGERTEKSVLDAFESIETDTTHWDCVVLIRGGGATSDLAAFESYLLAYRIASFHIPVIVGIGHERDITVLDYVANVRVKTPTAAADHLIQIWNSQQEKLNNLSVKLCDIVQERVHAETIQLQYLLTNLTTLPKQVLKANKTQLKHNIMLISNSNVRLISPAKQKIASYTDKMRLLLEALVERQKTNLTHMRQTVALLSPASVLKRGYTLTRTDGHLLTSAKHKPEPGETLTTIFYDGEITSLIQ